MNEPENDFMFDEMGNLMLDANGIPRKKPGIAFTDSDDNEYIYRLADGEATALSSYIRNYLNNHKEGYYLSLPGGDFSYPMQVEFLFSGKEKSPHLKEVCDFLENIIGADQSIKSAHFLVEIDEEDAKRYNLL